MNLVIGGEGGWAMNKNSELQSSKGIRGIIKMKGWILLENNQIVITCDNAIQVFKTKNDLVDYYGCALGDRNEIKRVDLK